MTLEDCIKLLDLRVSDQLSYGHADIYDTQMLEALKKVKDELDEKNSLIASYGGLE